MPFPKHRYAFVVMGAYGRLLRSGYNGLFYEGHFGEVFTDKRVADWIVRSERRIYNTIAEENDQPLNRYRWLQHAKNTRVLRIALPGTYPVPSYEALLELSREAVAEKREWARLKSGR